MSLLTAISAFRGLIVMHQLNDQAMTNGAEQSRGPRWMVKFGIVIAAIVCIAGFLYSIFSQKEGEAIVDQGRAHLAQGNFNLAIDFAERALKISPDLASGWRLLAEAHGRNSQFDQSIAALKAYCQHRPDDGGKLAIRLGNYWMQQNLVCPAVAAFQISEALGIEEKQSLLYQEQIAAVTGHTLETARCIIGLLRLDAYTRGDLMLLTSQFPRFTDRGRLEAILQADPKCKWPLLSVALDELDQSHHEAAERILLEITHAHPDDIDAQGVLADLYARYLPDKFISWHSQLPLEAQTDSRIWAARGKWLSGSGQTDSAIRCLYEALKREPEQLPATTLLGQLLKSRHQTEVGTAFTERARRMQKIIDLNGRLNETRVEQSMLEMIDELEQSGRLWEAWGFCSIYELTVSSNNPTVTKIKSRIKPQLTSELPRTKPGSLPGSDFDWEQFPLPDLSYHQETDLPTERKNNLTRIRFDDQARQAGLDFKFTNSYQANRGRNILETMGAGVAVHDFDLDGWPDIYFPQGSSSPAGTSQGPSDALYRNIRSERFEDITTYASIKETSYSQGAASGDFDSDGFPDIYVANFGRNCLYHNNGDGTFTDVTERAGLAQKLWTVSCAIADLDGDGFPELFDVNYVQGHDLLERTCLDQHGQQKVCRPTYFEAVPDTVVLNLGDGQFLEQQSEAGLDLPGGMGLGVVIADFNGDNLLDLFIANDMSANYLLVNQQDSSHPSLRFRDEAFLRNVALDENGLSQACMGIACADVNHDRQLDLFVTNFAKEANTLYLSIPDGFYQDATQATGLRQPSFEPLGFGTQFFDADQDGRFDLIVLNGHIDQFEGEEFEMKPQIFCGERNGTFTELFGDTVGPLFDVPRLGRGMALLDWNRDGRTDFVATDLEGPVLLGVNQSESPYRSLRLKLVGTQSSRDAIGAKVNVYLSSDEIRTYQLTAGDGYESSNERVIEICLGDIERVKRVEINWPSERTSSQDEVLIEGEWIVIEGRPDWIRSNKR